MLEGEGKSKTKTQGRRAAPGRVVAGDRWRRAGHGPERASVPRSRRGRRPREAPPRLRQTASVSGRGNPRRKDPAWLGKLKLGAFPQPRRFPVPPVSPLLSCLRGIRCFAGSFRGPAGPEPAAAGPGPRTCCCRSSLSSGAAASPGAEEGWVTPFRLVGDKRLQGCEGPVTGWWRMGGF